jgi:hypothetical protein
VARKEDRVANVGTDKMRVHTASQSVLDEVPFHCCGSSDRQINAWAVWFNIRT